MRWREVCRLGRDLPEVEEGTWFGVPALRVRGSILAHACDRKRGVVVKVAPGEPESLCRSRPGAFSLPEGHQQHPVVVIRLSAVGPDELWPFLVESWRRSAPPSLAATWRG